MQKGKRRRLDRESSDTPLLEDHLPLGSDNDYEPEAEPDPAVVTPVFKCQNTFSSSPRNSSKPPSQFPTTHSPLNHLLNRSHRVRSLYPRYVDPSVRSTTPLVRLGSILGRLESICKWDGTIRDRRAVP